MTYPFSLTVLLSARRTKNTETNSQKKTKALYPRYPQTIVSGWEHRLVKPTDPKPTPNPTLPLTQKYIKTGGRRVGNPKGVSHYLS